MDYVAELQKDIRFVEGLNACLQCGVCSAICPAAEFYNYDPRIVVVAVQEKNNQIIEDLLKSETIWYCGQCMSCKTRCPRGNTPGFIIQALRTLSQKYGFFTESEKGRQQYAIKKTVGQNILDKGYCVHPDLVAPELHPEQGPIWEWIVEHKEAVYDRLGAHLYKDGPGALRKIEDESLQEIHEIFKATGGIDLYEQIESASQKKAEEMNIAFDNEKMNDYLKHVYTTNNNSHLHE